MKQVDGKDDLVDKLASKGVKNVFLVHPSSVNTRAKDFSDELRAYGFDVTRHSAEHLSESGIEKIMKSLSHHKVLVLYSRHILGYSEVDLPKK